MSVTLKVPSIGESIREATVGVWKKGEGDWIQLDEPLVEIESEKATLEVPAPSSGVLKKILRHQGDTVAIGEALADIDETARPAEKTAAPAKPAAAPAKAASASAPVPANGSQSASAAQVPAAAPAQVAAGPAPAASDPVRAAPSARKLMADAGLGVSDVQGSGRGGRIQGLDVARALESRQAAAPVPVPVTLLDERTPMESRSKSVV